MKLVEAERVSGRIIIPDNAKDKVREGRVIGVGLGRYSDAGERIPMDVEPDDVVLFGRYSGSEVKVDGELLLIIRERDILAIVEE